MHVRLSAPDIACKSCANAITNALNRLSGVQQVTVDIAGKLVDVQFDEAQVSIEQILQRLDDAGFPATVVFG
ncbi:MAG: heavy-metal-associated domain-containing protein [Chthonomonadetes bacterium]|nr:heavy-metal-associated domain-containing protein [Chthonomonadetes bacterium]